jgi:hypothetical protein
MDAADGETRFTAPAAPRAPHIHHDPVAPPLDEPPPDDPLLLDDPPQLLPHELPLEENQPPSLSL